MFKIKTRLAKKMDKSTVDKFIKLILPAIASSMIFASYGIVDTIFAGQFIDDSEAALASMGYNIIYLTASVMFSAGLATGLGIKLNEYLAKNDKSEASRIINSYIPLSLILFIPLILISSTLAKYFVFLGAGFTWPEETVLNFSIQYIMVFGLFSWSFILVGTTDGLILNQGKAGISTIFSLIGFISNFIFNAIFVILLDMEVLGLAIATGISQIPVFVCQAIYLKKYAPFKATKIQFKDLGRTFKECMSSGSSTFIIRSFNIVLLLSFTFFIGLSTSGAEKTYMTATAMVVFNAFIFFNVFPTAAFQATQQLTVKGYFTKNEAQVKTTLFLQLSFVVLFSIIVTIWVTVAPGSIISLFLSENDPNAENVFRNSKLMLPILFVGFPLVSFGQFTQSFLVSVNDSKKSTIISVIMVITIPLFFAIAIVAAPFTWMIVFGIIGVGWVIYLSSIALFIIVFKQRGSIIDEVVEVNKKRQKKFQEKSVENIKSGNNIE